ncbi:hypothetical protein C8Q74DRAFT_660754 [Fomes fomentarius]|nr:hypothetical protein C8Q74DRAFT_660754 [Fomes fomentarius]
MLTGVVSVWRGGAALVDVIIAASMTVLLLRGKSDLMRSDFRVHRLVQLTIETGSLTAIVAIVDLLCFTAFSSTLLYECPSLVLTKLYSNTLVESLKNRAVLRIAENGIVDVAGVTGLGNRVDLDDARSVHDCENDEEENVTSVSMEDYYRKMPGRRAVV